MKFLATDFADAWLIAPERHEDERGYFARTWCRREFEDRGLNSNLLQTSTSFNHRRGTLRGMHFQAPPHEEAKVVRCVRGRIFDVIVDLRPDSPTRRAWQAFHLEAGEQLAIYVPEGFAHGFLTLADNSEVHYQMSEFYVPESAGGFRWDDPSLAISWPGPVEVISSRDEQLPPLPAINDRAVAATTAAETKIT